MYGLIESLQDKLDQGDYSIDRDTLEDVVKMLRFHEKKIETLEALNERLRAREKSMWSLDEVSAYLEISKQTLYNMIRDKRIKAHKVGREWRFYPSDIEGHIALGCNIQEDQNG